MRDPEAIRNLMIGSTEMNNNSEEILTLLKSDANFDCNEELFHFAKFNGKSGDEIFVRMFCRHARDYVPGGDRMQQDLGRARFFNTLLSYFCIDGDGVLHMPDLNYSDSVHEYLEAWVAGGGNASLDACVRAI